MSSPSDSSTTDISRILDFWFDDRYPPTRWFKPDPALDTSLSQNFSPLMQKARAHDLDSWQSSPRSTLALLLLLDQFPRNCHRNTPDAFATDSHALDIATRAIARGFDTQVPLIQQVFFYTPLVHSETLLGQIAAKALYQHFAGRCEGGGDGGRGGADEQVREFARFGVVSADRHMATILRFGRFPSRNQALGRENTEEEEAFLAENPSGFVAAEDC